MNGPQHYAEAERLSKLSAFPGLPGGSVRMESVALAQVHATLALAAATAEAAFDPTGHALVSGRPTGRLEWSTVLYPPEESDEQA